METHQSDESPERTAPQGGDGFRGFEGDSFPSIAGVGPKPGDTDTPGHSPQEIRPSPGDEAHPDAIPQEIEPLEDDRIHPGPAPDELQ